MNNENGTKPWYQSKIVWVQFLVFLIAALELTGEHLSLDTEAKTLIMLVTGLLTIALRTFFTYQPTNLAQKQPEAPTRPKTDDPYSDQG